MIDMEKHMNDIISRCGYRCNLCLAYKENITQPGAAQQISDLWEKYFGFRIMPEDIYCDGCLCVDDEPRLMDAACKVRPCVIEKGVTTCADCDECGQPFVKNTCEKLSSRIVRYLDLTLQTQEPIPFEEYRAGIQPYTNAFVLNGIRLARIMRCEEMPCTDVNRTAHTSVYGVENPENIRIMMISEAPPADPRDHFYMGPEAFCFQTTAQAFADAGYPVASMADIHNYGVYLTTAVKCGKTGYAIATDTISRCAALLKNEIAFFPNIQVFMLMGDVAIKAFNHIARTETGKAVIPSKPTYKIRGNIFYYKSTRVFPSYVLTGKNFLIEKSKRIMIAEDIKMALELVKTTDSQI